MIYRELLGANLANDETILMDVNVGEYETISVHAADGGGTTFWSTGVIAVRWRNNEHATPLDFSSAKSLSAPGGLESIDVSGVRIVTLQVTTAQSGVRANLYVVGKNRYRSV